jgi:hypothetical protein
MANCGAGECSCECGKSEGCGCIASSDDPTLCECHCYGASTAGKGILQLSHTTLVDVSIKGLPLGEVTKFLNAVLPVPVHAHSEHPRHALSVEFKGKPLSDVLKVLGLEIHQA